VRRFVDATIGVMLEPRARRAIDETLLDWAHESQLARDPLAGLLCHARAASALGRTITTIVLQEVAELPKNTVWLRATVWLIVPFLTYLSSYNSLLPPAADAGAHLIKALLLFPSWLVMFGPVALFLAAIWHPRAGRPRTPFLGLAVLSLAVALVNAGWVMPAANQEFREVTFRWTGGKGPLVRGAAELTLPQLLSTDSFRPRHAKEKQLHARLAFVASCPVLVMLAGQLHDSRRRNRCFAAVLVWLLAGGGFVKLATDSPLGVWLLPVGGMAAGLVIGIWRHARCQPSLVKPPA
jgi:lipopolysaccharide export LptBFGC system permease protein LptF